MENDRPHNTNYLLNKRRKINKERIERVDKDNKQMTMLDNQIEHLLRLRNTNRQRGG